MIYKKLFLMSFILSLTLLSSFLRANNAKFLPITVEGLIQDDIRVSSFMGAKNNSLRALLTIINRAKRDASVKGIVLKIKSPRLGLAKLQELREALKAFKNQGKTIYAFSETFSKTDYLLASVANRLYVSPQGGVDLSGIALELVFLKNTFNMLGVSPNFHQMGNYKSASEIYTRSRASKYQKESINFLLDGLFDEFVSIIAEGRKISKGRVLKLVDRGFFSAAEAKKAKLIDGFLYEDKFEEIVQKNGGVLASYQNNKRSGRARKPSSMELLMMLYKKPPKKSNAPKIAIIYMEGTIISGKSKRSLFGGSNAIGSDDFTAILRQVRKDPKVKAVVIRINSPGGSALASDILWREVRLLSQAKPVIASLSDVAASGGYYIAMACPTIIANSTTITGSIGVVGGKFNLKGLYNKVGLNKEIFKRGKYADLFTDYRNFTPEENKLIAKQMLETYKTFVRKAAQGRKMTIKKMNVHAQGKIYTGTQALKVGLVDQLGGIDFAIRLARKKVRDFNNKLEIVTYPEQKSFMELLSSNLFMKQQLEREIESMQIFAKPLIIYLKYIQRIFSKERVATLMPFYIHY